MSRRAFLVATVAGVAGCAMQRSDRRDSAVRRDVSTWGITVPTGLLAGGTAIEPVELTGLSAHGGAVTLEFQEGRYTIAESASDMRGQMVVRRVKSYLVAVTFTANRDKRIVSEASKIRRAFDGFQTHRVINAAGLVDLLELWDTLAARERFSNVVWDANAKRFIVS